MDQGKTNQFGRKEIGACIRNKLYEICPVGALGIHLFQMFQTHTPSFMNSREYIIYNVFRWFDLKLVPGRNGPASEISYQAHLNAIKKCFESLGNYIII
jgi:hypothetical protein